MSDIKEDWMELLGIERFLIVQADELNRGRDTKNPIISRNSVSHVTQRSAMLFVSKSLRAKVRLTSQ
jgi:hypothetical protein